jgi:hypothetical protein
MVIFEVLGVVLMLSLDTLRIALNNSLSSDSSLREQSRKQLEEWEVVQGFCPLLVDMYLSGDLDTQTRDAFWQRCLLGIVY